MHDILQMELNEWHYISIGKETLALGFTVSYRGMFASYKYVGTDF